MDQLPSDRGSLRGQHQPFTQHSRQPSPQNTKIQQPQSYADAVRSYSRLSTKNSLYAGGHLESLASYLQLPYEQGSSYRPLNRDNEQLIDPHPFVSIYNITSDPVWQATHFNRANQLEAAELDSSSPKVIFMRGLPSPEWLLAIGVKFQVDPEFFSRHLEFYEGLPRHFTYPSLPSANKSTTHLRVTTIGYSKIGDWTTKYAASHAQEAVESFQKENVERMSRYRERMKSRMHSNNVGDSIIRDLSIHDTENFSIEQDISVFIGRNGETWNVLVWLDNGEDLATGFTPWSEFPLRFGSSKQISYLPVVQIQPGIALNRQMIAQQHEIGNTTATTISQSASWLHLHYGRTLINRNLIIKNPFYALREIFSFVACSEVQFINMLESKVEKELDSSTLVWQKNPTLSNLLYSQQILDRHIKRIRENLAFIGQFSTAVSRHQGPPVDSGKPDEAGLSAEELLRDYEYLLSRATTLSQQCNRGMQVVMNNATIKESREAITQAEGVVMLTRLAFIFVPLTYVASIFGMNFVQFGQGELSIWLWPAVSLPVFGLSLLFVRGRVLETLSQALIRPLADQM